MRDFSVDVDYPNVPNASTESRIIRGDGSTEGHDDIRPFDPASLTFMSAIVRPMFDFEPEDPEGNIHRAAAYVGKWYLKTFNEHSFMSGLEMKVPLERFGFPVDYTYRYSAEGKSMEDTLHYVSWANTLAWAENNDRTASIGDAWKKLKFVFMDTMFDMIAERFIDSPSYTHVGFGDWYNAAKDALRRRKDPYATKRLGRN